MFILARKNVHILKILSIPDLLNYLFRRLKEIQCLWQVYYQTCFRFFSLPVIFVGLIFFIFFSQLLVTKFIP